MEATLKFNLNDADEKDSFEKCVKGSDLHFALWNFDQKLRARCKYDGDTSACEIREILYDILDNLKINL